MDSAKDAGYKWIVKEFIKKTITIFGPSVTLVKVKKIPGLTTDEKGNIVNMIGDAGILCEKILKEFILLSPVAVKNILDSIILASSDLQTALGAECGRFYALFSEIKASALNFSGYSPSDVNSSQITGNINNNTQNTVNLENPAKNTIAFVQGDNVGKNLTSVEKLDSGKIEELGKIFEGVSTNVKSKTVN